MVIRTRALMLTLGAVALVLALGYGSWAYTEGRPPFGPSDDKWSGVFLTNGQAYFGHFYNGPGDYAILRDVYYVLATQLQSQDPNAQSQTQLSLQKLGNEIHGPQPEMRISKAQILFVEELRADSPLVRAIFQQKNAPPGPAPTGATSAPTQAPATPSPSPARSPSPSPR